MTKEIQELFKCRVDCVVNILSHYNSAADIHKVGNLRNRASLLLELIKMDQEETMISGILKRLENDLVDFIKRKYGYIK